MNNRQQIGLNLNYMIPGVVGGTETYASGLVWALASASSHFDFAAYVNKESSEWPLPLSQNFKRIVCPVDATNRFRRYRFEQAELPRLLDSGAIALVHSLGYVSPLFTTCPRIVTIHDLNFVSTSMPLAKRLPLSFFVKCSAIRAQKVIAPSIFSRNQIMKAFGLHESQIRVIHEAPRQHLISAKHKDETSALVESFGIRQPYVMAFASNLPHKNIGRLLESFDRSVSQFGIRHQLVLVGRFSLPSNIVISGTALDRLVLTGYLSDSAVIHLLGEAQFIVVPSLYEGFGLPVLEAMQLGVPVASSNAGSLPEVAGNAALLFDARSVDEIAEAIVRLANDDQLRTDLRAKGLINVGRFSWEKAAAETIAVYDEVLSTDIGSHR